MIELIGCPMHFGVSDKGLMQAISELNRQFAAMNIREIAEVLVDEGGAQAKANLKNLHSVAATCAQIAQVESDCIAQGNTPLFFGGDHAAAIGTVAGAAAHTDRLGLLWIDAHSDINTDATTVSGNIHGMPVSALMGEGNAKLCSIFGDQPKLAPQDAVLFGLRDVDPPEWEIIRRLGVKCYPFEEIARRGQDECLAEALDYLKPVSRLHISFDLDSMDPKRIPGVTVPVEGGFTERAVLTLFEQLLPMEKLSSIDIVEYNPAYDIENRTARFVNELTEFILSRCR